MGNIFELAINTINKDLIVIKIVLEKILELYLYYLVFGFGEIFIVILLLDHYFAEKQDSKRDLIEFVGFKNFKIVFMLLLKAIIIKT